MNEKDFCLLKEPWILLMRSDGCRDKLSLIEALRHANEYTRLAGESPLQDVAVLRLMLAVLHVVLARYDACGEYFPLNEDEAESDIELQDVIERWREVWQLKAFPMEPIESYLSQYEERFYLFHPTTPFFQVAEMTKATCYTAAKLNGELSESNNKIRLFASRTGKEKNELDYDEAARWLLYVNGFDDTAVKKQETDGDGTPGAGWLGKLGLIYACGENLFETLMLNLVMLRDGNKLWDAESPIWERPPRRGERVEIPLPNNQAELLTLQSRRLLLQRRDDRICGYGVVGGDFFQKENALAEQMTLWRNAAKKETDPPIYVPCRHDPERRLWRDFASIAAQTGNKKRPGVVEWVSTLMCRGYIKTGVMRFVTVSLKYGDKDFFAADSFSDELSFNLNLLTELGVDWTPRIQDSVSAAEKLARQAGILAAELVKCGGAADPNGKKQRAMGEAYYRMDEPFRQWLERIDPERDGGAKDKLCMEWALTAQKITREVGRELVSETGAHAFVGRTEKEKKGKADVERRYTASEAYNRFIYFTSIKCLTV